MENPRKPSPKQKKMIKELEKISGEKFQGQTIQEACEYITKHQALIPKIDFREAKKPSKKQMDTIEKINKLFSTDFVPKSMKEACEILDEYLPKYLEYWEEKRKGGKK